MMTPNDPDLPVQDMPRMVPDREDIASRKVKRSSPERKPVEPEKPGFPVWVPVMIFVLFGLSGYSLWQNSTLSAQLMTEQQELQLSNARIKVLENQLSATDENLVMNEANIKAQFNSHMSEIRKLWDVANKRNRGWIEDNQNAIKSLKSDLGRSATSIKNLETQANTQLTRVQELNQTLKNAEQSMKSMQTRQNLSSAKLDELVLEQSLLAEQIRSRNLDQLRADLQSLSSSIDGISQDIASINNSRLQVNQRLKSLQDQLIAMEAKLIEPSQP